MMNLKYIVRLILMYREKVESSRLGIGCIKFNCRVRIMFFSFLKKCFLKNEDILISKAIKYRVRNDINLCSSILK